MILLKQTEKIRYHINILAEEKSKLKNSFSLSKDAFSSLLNKLHKNVFNNAAANLKSGFERCGIHLLNKERILFPFLVNIPAPILLNETTKIRFLLWITACQHCLKECYMVKMNHSNSAKKTSTCGT